jgi:UDP-N-acetylglucosamine diphosphorylase/glucosamine-1-phosphate N-acetyltransferase
MIGRIYILEDDREKYLPLTLTRPLAEIRAGAFTFRERLQKLFPTAKIAVSAPSIVAEVWTSRTGIPANRLPDGEGPILAVKPNYAFDQFFRDKAEVTESGTAFLCDGEVFAVLADFDNPPDRLSDKGMRKIELSVEKIPAIWDVVNINDVLIQLDFRRFFGPSMVGEVHRAATIYSPGSVFIAEGAEISAGAVVDARNGPVIICQRSVIRPGAVIEGPCYIGPDCTVVSGWIRPGCSFGPNCRIGGEIEASIFQGYSNKYHEGFIGHSYIGEWVNLGALTTTSDLKNNYGVIRVDFGEGEIDTKRIKVGSFIGDHSKTGIGTLLNSGTYIGASVNHYGTGLPPKFIPSFSWGGAEGYIEYDVEKAISTAKIVMFRRGLEMAAVEEKLLREIHSSRKNSKSY